MDITLNSNFDLTNSICTMFDSLLLIKVVERTRVCFLELTQDLGHVIQMLCKPVQHVCLCVCVLGFLFAFETGSCYPI